MILSPGQQTVYDELCRFIEARRAPRQYYTLHGLAGTGKTTLLAELTRAYRGLRVTAFTGKAASVLRRKTGAPVSTLHQAIYDFKGLVQDEFNKHKRHPVFSPKGEPLPDDVILIDEISMVGQRIALDLLDTGARVIACGDPGQLPPVRDSQFFTTPNAALIQIHRQALDSPIIRQAHNIRNNSRYEADGDNFRVISFAHPHELLDHDILLCWRNRTRRGLNRRKRELLGLTGPLTPGEPIMALKNDHQLGVYNGAIYTVADNSKDGLIIDSDGVQIEIEQATIEGEDKQFEVNKYDEDYLPFAPAWAATVHKSQGSEYPFVLLFDECHTEWKSFMYTGCSRAVEKCTVVRWRN